MKESLVAEILELPVAERVKLVEAIWDSIRAAPEALPRTVATRGVGPPACRVRGRF